MNRKIYLCFDIGATSTKFAYIDYNDLSIIKKGSFLTKKEPNLFVQEFLINNLLNEIKLALSSNEIIGVCIDSAGGVDMINQEITYCNPTMIDYVGVNWKKEITNKFDLKTVLLNDVKAAGLSEFILRDVNSAAMITLGTGLGASFYIDKQLYLGSKFLAGEIGQMVWPYDNSITVDTACSVVIATDKIKNLINDQSFKLSEVEKIVNNKEAMKIRNEWLFNVAKIIKFIDYFYDPELYIIGGGISKYECLISDIQTFLPKDFKKLEIAVNGNDAGFFGSISYFKKIYNI